MSEPIRPLDDEDFERFLSLGVDGYSEGQLDDALLIFKGLLKVRPQDPRPAKMMASTLLLLERYTEAEVAYEQALELDRHDAYTLVALAELKLRSLQVEEASQHIYALLEGFDAKHPAVQRACKLVQELTALVVAKKQ